MHMLGETAATWSAHEDDAAFGNSLWPSPSARCACLSQTPVLEVSAYFLALYQFRDYTYFTQKLQSPARV